METSYSCVKDLMKKPLHVEEELSLRKTLTSSIFQTINMIVILDSIALEKYEIKLISKTYNDIREVLVKIG